MLKNLKTVRTFACVVLIAGLAAGCGKKNDNAQKAPANQTVTNQVGNGGGQMSPGQDANRQARRAMRQACMQEIQTLCATDQKKLRCLKQNTAKLSPACLTAVNNVPRGGGRHGGRGMRQRNGMQLNGTQQANPQNNKDDDN